MEKSTDKREKDSIERNRACVGKSQFIDKKEATRGANRLFEKYNDARLRAYPCAFCPFWHIGH